MNPKKECDDIRALLSAYLDGEIPEADRRTVERHLEDCAACREVLSQWRRIDEAVAGLGCGLSLPRSLAAAVRESIEKGPDGENTARRGDSAPVSVNFGRILRWAAVVMFLVGGVLGMRTLLSAGRRSSVETVLSPRETLDWTGPVEMAGKPSPGASPEREGVPGAVPAPASAPAEADGFGEGDSAEAAEPLPGDGGIAGRRSFAARTTTLRAVAEPLSAEPPETGTGSSPGGARQEETFLLARAEDRGNAVSARPRAEATPAGVDVPSLSDGMMKRPPSAGWTAFSASEKTGGELLLEPDSVGGLQPTLAESPGRMILEAADPAKAAALVRAAARNLRGEAVVEEAGRSEEVRRMTLFLPGRNVDRFVRELETGKVRVVRIDLAAPGEAPERRAAMKEGEVSPAEESLGVPVPRGPAGEAADGGALKRFEVEILAPGTSGTAPD